MLPLGSDESVQVMAHPVGMLDSIGRRVGNATLDSGLPIEDGVARHPADQRRDSWRHRSCARGQRGWKAQPGGGVIGLGISPAISGSGRPRVEISGTASSSIRV